MSFWKREDSRALVRQFCDKHARHPEEKPGLRENHTRIIEKLFERLRSKGLVNRLEHTGSAYTGLEIGPDREFDVTFVITMGGITITKYEGELYYLKARNASPHNDCVSSYGATAYLDPQKLQTKFYGLFEAEAQRISDELQLGYRVQQKRHGGTAIQWDVYERGVLLYSVDLVPAIEEVSPAKRYPLQFVATSGEGKAAPETLLWRQSFSLQENDLLKKLSAGDQCQKQVVRTLKAMIQQRPGYDQGWGAFSNFRSYLTYAAVLHENQRLNNPAHWTQEQFADRLRDTLAYLQQCMVAQRFRHPFLPEVDLTEWKPSVYAHNRDRLGQILNNETAFRNVFSH